MTLKVPVVLDIVEVDVCCLVCIFSVFHNIHPRENNERITVTKNLNITGSPRSTNTVIYIGSVGSSSAASPYTRTITGLDKNRSRNTSMNMSYAAGNNRRSHADADSDSDRDYHHVHMHTHMDMDRRLIKQR